MSKDIKIINDDTNFFFLFIILPLFYFNHITFFYECTASLYLGRIGKEVSLYICTYCYEYTPVVNDSLYMPSKNVYNLFPVCPCCGMKLSYSSKYEEDTNSYYDRRFYCNECGFERKVD